MLGEVRVHYATPVAGQHQQHEPHSESRRGHNEEVQGDKLLDVVIEERSPALG